MKKFELCIISKWSHELSHTWEWYGQICFKKDEDPICETAKKTQKYRTVFWTLWEKARVGWFSRIALKHVYYHMWNRSPVQVRCMRQGAQRWCTGMTLRDGMGDTCTPMADSCQYMAKPLQYCKVISLQLK